MNKEFNIDFFWNKIKEEVYILEKSEKVLSCFYQKNILEHNFFASALAYILANKIESEFLTSNVLFKEFYSILIKNTKISIYAMKDLIAIHERDPAIQGQYSIPLLFYKGFHALELARISHHLWMEKKYNLALYLQSQNSRIFQVDIHPAAKLGYGIMLDHATGIVIGETAAVSNNVSILQNVTLGGTGKESGDRHPKILEGVMIGAGAKILGNLIIGKGSKVGSGSVVLKNVPDYTTVAGVPAKIISKHSDLKEAPSITMEQNFTSL